MLNETFRVEDGVLIRSVIPRRGTPYEHACTEAVYEDVAYEIVQSGSAHNDAARHRYARRFASYPAW